jgi:hypothetical protein
VAARAKQQRGDQSADLAAADLRFRHAETRKVEAETVAIEAQTEERRARTVLLWTAVLLPWILLALALILAALNPPGFDHGGVELLDRWLPLLLSKP